MRAAQEKLDPPSLFYLFIEGRAVGELATSWLVKPLLRRAPRGDGHPVMTLPGFVASDVSTIPLRRYLNELGYAAHPWNLGRNHGPSDHLEERLLERISWLAKTYGRKVSLVGWSLGGIYARELAHRAPEVVRSVITLGSPFARDPRANHSWRVFEWLSGREIDGIPHDQMARIREPPPVPTTAIYTRSDGITNWKCCVEPAGPRAESIRVPGSHCGLGFNPLALYAVADRLAQPEDAWRPFDRSGFKRWLYAEPAASA